MVRAKFGLAVLLGHLLLLAGGAYAATFPEIAKGLDWLKAQPRSDGSLAGEQLSVGALLQARAESFRLLQQQTEILSGAAVDAVLAAGEDNTEFVARKIILAAVTSRGTAALALVLAARQNGDGGFGPAPGYQSSVLDTAWALLALRAANAADAAVIQRALAYQSQHANVDGGFGADGSSVFATGYVLLGTAAHSVRFGIAPLTGAARGWLVARQVQGAYGNVVDNAVAVLALAGTGIDNSVFADAVTALRQAQSADGSWNSDPYATALALSALVAADGTSAPGAAGALSGTIVDADTGTALAGVTIAIGGPQNLTAFSGPSGTFLVGGLGAGDYTLQINQPGYATAVATARVALGSTTSLGTIALRAAATTATLRGQVRDGATGGALAGALISLSSGQSAVVDAAGAYVIAGVLPGAATIVASKSGYDSASAQAAFVAGGTLVFSPSLYPAGQPPQPVTAHGSVVDADTGAALAGATVQLGTQYVSTDGQGAFTVAGLSEGAATLQLVASGYRQASYQVTLGPGNNDFGRLALAVIPATITVTGRITDAQSSVPLAGATVVVVGTALRAGADPGGAYQLVGVETPEFTLSVAAAGYARKTVTVSLPSFGDTTVDIALSKVGSATGLSLVSVTTDRPGYDPFMSLEIEAEVSNAGATDQQLIFSASVLDPSGVETIQAPERGVTIQPVIVPAGQTVEVELETHLADQPAGLYTVEVRGYDRDGVLQVEGATSFVINPIRRVAGGITLDPPLTQAGVNQTVAITANLYNSGNLPIPAGAAQLTVVVDAPDASASQRVDLVAQTLLAGAPLDSPTGVVYDAQGNAYAVNRTDRKIVKITPTRQASVLLTLPALLTNPTVSVLPIDLAIDTSGNLYVLNVNAEVFRVAPDGGLTRIATGLSNQRAIDVDSAGNLYVSETNGPSVVRITPAGVSTTLMRGGLDQPVGAVFGADGALYVANNAGNSITRIDSAGRTQPFVTGLSRPQGLTADSAGNFYVANSGAGNILKITPAGSISVYASGIASPFDLRFDSQGVLYVTAQSGGTPVVKVLPGGSVQPFAKGVVESPQGMTYGPAGELYVVGATQVVKLDAQDNVSTVAVISGGRSVAVAPSGELYVTRQSAGQVVKIAPDGSTTTFASGLGGPSGVALDGSGGLFVGEFQSTRISRLSAAGARTTLAESLVDSPDDLYVDAGGRILALNAQSLTQITGDGQGATLAASVATATSVTRAADGTVYLLEPTAIKKLDAAGAVVTVRSGLPSLANGIVVDASGNVYFAELTSRQIRRLDAAGVLSTVATLGAPPKTIISDSAGGFFVLLTSNQLVQVSGAGVVTTLGNAGTGFRLAHDAGANQLYVSTVSGVSRMDLATRVISVAVTRANLRAIAVTANGELLAGDIVTDELLWFDAQGAPRGTVAGFGRPLELAWTGTELVFNDSARIYALTPGGYPRVLATGASSYLAATSGAVFATTATGLAKVAADATLTPVFAQPGLANLAGVAARGDGALSFGASDSRIMTVTVTGTVLASYAGITAPLGLAIDAADRVYAVTRSGAQIVRIDATGKRSEVVAANAVANGIGFDAAGVLYSASAGSLSRYDAAGTRETVATAASGAALRTLALSADGVFVTDSGTQSVWRLTGSSLLRHAAGVSGPQKLKVGPDGAVYVASQTNGLVLRTTPAGPEIFASGLTLPIALAFKPSGELLVGNLRGDLVSLDASGAATTIGSVSALAATGSLDAIAVDGAGVPLIARGGRDDLVRVFTLTPPPVPAPGTVVHTMTASYPEIPLGPEGIRVDFGAWLPPYGGDFRVTVQPLASGVEGQAVNRLHVGPGASGTLTALRQSLVPGDNPVSGRVDVQGADFTAIAKVDASNISLAVSTGAYPKAMGVDAAGNLYFSELNSKQLRKVPADGSAPTVVWTGQSNIGMRGMIPVDNQQNLYVSGGTQGMDVVRLAPDGSSVVLASLPEAIVSLVRNSVDDIIAMTAQRLYRVKQDGTVYTLGSAGLGTGLYSLTIDGRDNLYVQNNDNTISRIAPDSTAALLINDPTINFEYEGVNIAGDCADNLFVTPFRWPAFDQLGEEATLVQVVGRTGQAAQVLDGRQINNDLKDMDFIVYDRFSSTLLIWTDLSGGRIYRVPVSCGAISTDLHLVFPAGQAVNGFSIAPAATLSLPDGATEYVWSLQAVTTLGQRVDFDTTLAGLGLGEQRALLREAFLVFQNSFVPGEVKVPLAVPTLGVEAPVELRVATDRASYGPHVTALVDGQLANRDSEPRIARLTLDVTDAAGVPVARIVEQNVALDAAGLAAAIGPFDTGTHAPGPYTVTGVITDVDSGIALARASASFQIVSNEASQARASARISADKASYLPSDTVRLRDRITNLLQNTPLDAAEVTTRVLNPDGSLRFDKTELLVQLAPGAQRDYEYSLALGFAPPGDYRATLSVRRPGGDELGADHATFTVLSSADTGTGLVGTVAAAPKAVALGDAALLSWSAANQGNAAIAGVALKARIIDPTTAQIIAEFPFTSDLAVGQTLQASVSWTATGAPGTTYVVALLAGVGPSTLLLAQDLLTVVAPPIKLEVSHGIGRDARVLVLASCSPGQVSGQPAIAQCAADKAQFLRAYLTLLGVEHQVVLQAEDFERELRCGRYDVFWVSGGAEKLSAGTAKALREAVFGGGGLVIDGDHDQRNGLLDEIAGVLYRGHLPHADPTVVLGGDLFAAGELQGQGTALDLLLAGGSAQASFADGGTPAIVTRSYGQGRGLIAGFDLADTLRTQIDSAQPWRAAFEAMLATVAPAAQALAEGAFVPVTTRLDNLGQAASVEVRMSLPASAQVLSSVPAATVTETEAVWRFDLAAQQSQSLRLDLRLPAGNHDLAARVAVVRNGQAQPYGSYPLGVEVRSTAQLLDAADASLALLQPTGPSEPAKAAHARGKLADARTAVAQQDFAAAIAALIDAVDDLRGIGSISIEAQRLALARLLQGASLRWCSALCAPAAPRAHTGVTFVPFADLERLEVRGGRPGSADWEWGLGANTQQAGSFVPQNLDWVADKVYRWVLSYDGQGGGSYSVYDGATLLFSRAYTGNAGPLRAGNTLELYVSSSGGIGKARVSATVDAIDGLPVTGALATAGNGNLSDARLYYYYPQMTGGFTASGTVKLSFNGAAPPAGSQLDFIVRSGSVSCTQ